MDISVNWLKKYVNLDGLTIDQISHSLTDIGLEVEAIRKTAAFGESVVVGKITEAVPHPNADSLRLCKVDVGAIEPLSIVCGAPNARVGIDVCVATVGTELPGGLKIKEAKIRGEASFGMLCSSKELGLNDDHGGIIELKDSPKPGTPVITALGLDDAVLTLNVTPNRADCLGYVGVARDLAARLNRPIKEPNPLVKGTPGFSAKDITVKIESERCARFSTLAIRKVKPVASPEWLKTCVNAAGMRSINLLVDVTNFVMLEMNHPIHAYDERGVHGRSFIIREAKDNETFTTLDGVERKLVKGDLLICDEQKPIGLAGIMGGQNSEIKEDTQSIILEAAYFDASSVRVTSKRLGMHTEASHRFERGTDIMGCERVAKRFAEVLLMCASELQQSGVKLETPEVTIDVNDVFPSVPQPRLIALRVSEAKNFLASPHLNQELIKKYFTALGIRLVDHNQERMVFEIPSWRVDIERECDLIEEIGRLQGYDKVPLQLPSMSLAPTPEDALVEFAELSRISFAGLGLRETISFPFWSNEEAKKLLLDASHPLVPSIKLKNPISDDAGLMQTSLVTNLLKAISLNRRHGVKGAQLFEVGRGYFDFTKKSFDYKTFSLWKTLPRKGRHLTLKAREDKNRPTERHWIGGILDQPWALKSWDQSEKRVDFFTGKSIVEAWLGEFGIRGAEYLTSNLEQISFLHPKTSALITYKGQTLGWLGEIHPQVAINFELDAADAPIVFELDMEAVLDAAGKRSTVSTESFKFPPSTRDLAMVLDATVTHDEMKNTILKFTDSKFLKSWNLFDVYQGSNIPAGKKSIAWSFTFQSPERTLTDAEVDQEFKKLTGYITQKFNAEQRA